MSLKWNSMLVQEKSTIRNDRVGVRMTPTLPFLTALKQKARSNTLCLSGLRAFRSLNIVLSKILLDS